SASSARDSARLTSISPSNSECWRTSKRCVCARIAMLPCEEDDVADRINAADIMHRQFKGHPAKCVVEHDSVLNAPPGVEIRRCTAGVRFGTSSAITPKRASVVIGIISATKTTYSGCCADLH